MEVKQDYVNPLFNQANVLRELGKLDEAVAGYRQVLAIAPARVDAPNNLGMALKQQGNVDEAVACYRRALELKPGRAETYCNLGVAFNDQAKLKEAIACYRLRLGAESESCRGLLQLGRCREGSGGVSGIPRLLSPGSRTAAGLCRWHGNLGSAWRKWATFRAPKPVSGPPCGTIPASRCALQIGEPLGGQAAGGGLDGFAPPGGTRLRRRRAGNPERLGPVASALWPVRVLDARGAYDEAAAHADRANALRKCESRKRGKERDAMRHEDLVAGMIAVCTPEFFQRTAGSGLDTEAPVFVFGLPRSGTTLIEQVLAGHSRVFAAGELNLAFETMHALAGPGMEPLEGLRRLDAGTARRLASAHLERLRALDPAALRTVNKTPENYLFLGLLAAIFPRAKFIHCRRDLRDVAISCWMTAFRDLRWVNDRQQIASRFHAYQRLMEHWRSVLPVPLLDVDYEEAVADLDGAARRLVAWCGLEWEPACLDFHLAKRPVGTASAVQVRRPLYTTSVGRWKHYEKSLAALLERDWRRVKHPVQIRESAHSKGRACTSALREV